jgi:hypothetical protein
MDEKIDVTETTLDVGLTDQIVVTVLGAIAGMLASKLVEKSYFQVKGRYQIRKATANKQ